MEQSTEGSSEEWRCRALADLGGGRVQELSVLAAWAPSQLCPKIQPEEAERASSMMLKLIVGPPSGQQSLLQCPGRGAIRVLEDGPHCGVPGLQGTLFENFMCGLLWAVFWPQEQMKGQQLPPDDDPGPRVGPSHPSDSSINHLVTGNHNPSYLAGGPENCLTCLTQDGAGIRSSSLACPLLTHRMVHPENSSLSFLSDFL
ncbi:hypothetical protein CB1_000123011 [Camelus ferus]|nr:hypothetical protein CB1_000123011 [Camelus ferus]